MIQPKLLDMDIASKIILPSWILPIFILKILSSISNSIIRIGEM